MSGTFVMMMAAAGGVAEQPIDGQTGVWLKAGGVTLSSGMKMTGAVVSSGQSQFVYSRGITRSCTVESGGRQYVLSGGTALYDSVGGVQYISAGGTAISGYYTYQWFCYGLISAATVEIGDGQPAPRVQSGGTAVDLSLRGSGDYRFVDVRDGAFASNVDIYEYIQLGVKSTGEVRGATIHSDGRLYVSAGANVGTLTIESGGNLTVFSGGTALAVTSNAGAHVVVSAGGHIEYA